MKRILIAFTIFLASVGLNAQPLKFKVEGMKDTTVFLAKYFGPKLYYADTTISKGSVFQFDGAKQKPGMYAIVRGGSILFEFIHDNEAVDMYVADQKDMVTSMKVNKSINNEVFYKYILFMTANKKKMTELTKQYDALPADSPEREKLKEQSKLLNKEVLAYQKKVVADNPGRFIASLIILTMEVDLPDFPKDEKGVITDSNYVYNYYIAHYWDGVNFKDPRIINAPVYHNKLEKFFSKEGGILQIPDTITKYASWMLNQMDMVDQENKVFQYTLSHIVNKYANMQIMGMDRVYWYLGANYYCAPNTKAYWMTPENLDDFCEKVNKVGRTLIGNFAPMLILTDTTEQNWINMYKVEAEYTVLYFWDPNCGHCKKTTPKLQTLYEEKFKKRGIEVFAVAKATGDDFVAWKKFIRDNKLSFINVGLTKSVYDQAMKDPRPLLQKTTLESLNYSDTYDVYSTPRIFVLDKDKKIKFKQIGVEQLEEIMDDITGHKTDVKLFPYDPTKPDDEQH
jgi:thiol-disulfide isomerase/thioredoxin